MTINGNIFNNVVGKMLENTKIDVDRRDVLISAFVNFAFAGYDTDNMQAIIDSPKFKKIEKYLDEGETITLKNGKKLKGYSSTTVETIIKEITDVKKFRKCEPPRTTAKHGRLQKIKLT